MTNNSNIQTLIKEIVMTNNVAETQAQVPAYIDQSKSRGNENVGHDDLLLPRIEVLQAQSPQLIKSKEQFIPGATMGMFFHTITGQIYEDGVNFTPISFVCRFLVWVDRKQVPDGGLRGVYPTREEAEQFIASVEDGHTLEVVPTGEHLVMLDSGEVVIMSMAKTKMKVSRKFNASIKLVGGDRFSRSYRMTSVDDSKPQGDFQNIKIVDNGFPTEDIYRACLVEYESIRAAGQKQTSYDEQSSQEY